MTAPSPKPAPPLTTGAVVADKYRIESLVGEGGMGYVFAAQHLQLGHRVALKVLHSSQIADRDVTERFLREGRALARLHGEHIARVSDVGTLATGEPYLVMEFLEGRDLAHELSARGPLPLDEVVDFLVQACEALAEAHVRGIVHRDLKPANLFLTHKLDGDVNVKVLDFGISKIAPGEDAGAEMNEITVTSTLVGTPKYMSPEQIQDSRSVDARTDIWGLGTIFYELLTQKRAFAAPSLALVCVKVLHEEVPPPSTLRPDLPPGVDDVIARCLKKRPDERFADVGELVLALVPFGGPSVRASATRVARILSARTGARLGADSSGSLPGVSSPSLARPDNLAAAVASRTPSAVRITEKGKEGETLTAATFVEVSTPKSRRNLLLAAGAGAFALGVILFFALRSSSKVTPAAQPTASVEPLAKAPATSAPTETAPPGVNTAAPKPTASQAEAPTAAPVVKRPPTHAAHHPTAHPATSTSETNDVLEDRR